MGDAYTEDRLERMEGKLDTLATAISQLAVVDARLSDFIQMNSRISVRISDLEKTTSALAQENAVQGVKLDALVKVTWTLASTVGLGVVGTVLKLIGLV